MSYVTASICAFVSLIPYVTYIKENDAIIDNVKEYIVKNSFSEYSF